MQSNNGNKIMKNNKKKLARKKRLTGLEIAPEIIADRPTSTRVPLTIRQHLVRWFIAVHANGYGVDTDLATAIRAAQETVAADAKPSQMALYVSDREVEPTGFVTWANGAKPRLVGLTNTHQGWEARG
jgi:hypothetical protein